MSLFCFRDSRSLPTPYCLQKPLRSDPSISFWPLTTSIGSLCSSTMPRCLCTFHPTWHTLPRSSEDWFLLVYPVSKVSITSTGVPARTTQSKVPFSCHTDRVCLFESTITTSIMRLTFSMIYYLSPIIPVGCMRAGPCLSYLSLCHYELYSLTHSRWSIIVTCKN